jgi:hypothetical protein
MVARNTPDGLLRAKPNIVALNWAKEKVALRINEVSIRDFMSWYFVNGTPNYSFCSYFFFRIHDKLAVLNESFIDRAVCKTNTLNVYGPIFDLIDLGQ